MLIISVMQETSNCSCVFIYPLYVCSSASVTTAIMWSLPLSNLAVRWQTSRPLVSSESQPRRPASRLVKSPRMQESRHDQDRTPSFCSTDQSARDARWDIRVCSTEGSDCCIVAALLLRTEDDTSPQRLPYYLSPHVNHPSAERADMSSLGLLNWTPVHINLCLFVPKAPHRNPHLV